MRGAWVSAQYEPAGWPPARPACAGGASPPFSSRPQPARPARVTARAAAAGERPRWAARPRGAPAAGTGPGPPAPSGHGPAPSGRWPGRRTRPRPSPVRPARASRRVTFFSMRLPGSVAVALAARARPRRQAAYGQPRGRPGRYHHQLREDRAGPAAGLGYDRGQPIPRRRGERAGDGIELPLALERVDLDHPEVVGVDGLGVGAHAGDR